MNKDVKAIWVKRLKSGQDTQICGMLHRRGSDYRAEAFCCLGVLTDIYLDSVGLTWSSVKRVRNETLPEYVAEWAGLEETDPSVTIGDTPTSLATLNDTGVPFERIGHIIKNQLGVDHAHL